MTKPRGFVATARYLHKRGFYLHRTTSAFGGPLYIVFPMTRALMPEGRYECYRIVDALRVLKE